MAEKKNIAISSIETNKGQIEGVPANPRTIKDKKFKKLVQSIEANPEMLDLRELLVYQHGDKYVIIGGNMRYEACKKLGYKELPCKVIPPETDAGTLCAYVVKDNGGYGEWDFDALANEWDEDLLDVAGIDLPEMSETEKLSELAVDESIYFEATKKVEKLSDCLDLETFKKKCELIDTLGLSDDKKELLKMFAYRFIRIDFEAVANYYTYASDEEKIAIERLRLVLIDSGLNGFIEDDLLKIANIGIEEAE